MKILSRFKQLKKDIKLVIITVLIMSCIGVYATGTCIVAATADDVTYNNTTVSAALNDLYELTQNYCPPGYECKALKYVTDCSNNKVYSTTPNNLSGLTKIMAEDAYLDNGKSEYVTSCDGVKFDNISSDTNGKGIYEIASTKDDPYPIYYYRGAVDNNNVKFGGFCWKAIRTTDTGGVKLIYNGEPDQDGYCTNTTGIDTQIGSSKYNTNANSPSDVGYMYGTRYSYSSNGGYTNYGISTYLFGNAVTYSNGTYTLTNPSTISDWSTNYNSYVGYYSCLNSNDSTCSRVGIIIDTSSSAYSYLILTNGMIGSDNLVFGNDIIYSGGTYTLTDTMAIKPNEWTTNYKTLKNYHYTCFSTGTTCSDVYYIYQIETNSYAHYITLTNGRKVEDALDEMFTNTTNSTAKTQIDNWYNTNLSSYTSSYIEDTIYCNDRRIGSLGGWNPNGGTVNSLLYFGKSSTAAPNLRCSRIQDKLTVSESIGNGNLTYPVGLITKDEIAYAGGAYMTSNNTYYLYNNLSYRSMTPDLYSNSDARVHSVSDSGSIGSSTVTVNTGLRPVISLKSTDVVESGDGTQTNPYVIKTS